MDTTHDPNAKNEHVPATQDDLTLALDILESHSFIKNAEFTMTSRRLFLTKNGCIGLGPAITSPGDICCVISGANIPHVLRPFNSDTYLMVGECYVQSIMHGEAVKDTPQWCNIILE
ncbi:hypothetical protein ST47_g9521 [Ascochyta rabiei]|uniref:Uncharacterized protein n=1 Tax=Didymella rabiei TaxID=5454 RepID=A0A162X1H9_DIDRA|nr:hypothetical protein ST47_g9521 [Ascochyta rabiei]